MPEKECSDPFLCQEISVKKNIIWTELPENEGKRNRVKKMEKYDQFVHSFCLLVS